MVSKMRAQRIADRIREELSEMLIQQISDPRLEGISVTDVKIDRELAYAEVYVSSYEGAERSAEILEGLKHAQGYLRHELALRVDIRSFPVLRFHWDPTFERAEHIERIIASLRAEEGTKAPLVEDLDESETDQVDE